METVAPGIRVVPVRTPTLPPATHTNTYVVGEGALSVFDPASPWDDERQRLHTALAERLEQGERVERIVLTHHHDDHVAGAEDLRRRLGGAVPIAAHPVTARLVADRITVDLLLEPEAPLACGDRTLTPQFTPGHAPGHLVFLDEASGAVIAGDMVAGVGTILISPVDGDLGAYLDSLEAMRRRSPTVLLPAHGPALHEADAVLAFYIAHRHQRTEQIRTALDRQGAATAEALAAAVYPELPREAHSLAAAQILSHLRWMERHGLARPEGARWV